MATTYIDQGDFVEVRHNVKLGGNSDSLVQRFANEDAERAARSARAKAERERQERERRLAAAAAALTATLDRQIVEKLAPQLAESSADIDKAFDRWRDLHPKAYARERLERLDHAAECVANVGAIYHQGLPVSLPADVVTEAAEKLRLEILAAAESAH